MVAYRLRMSPLVPFGHAVIRTSRGFTLIELLVVIAIVTILAAPQPTAVARCRSRQDAAGALLFPVLAQAREKARQTTCMSNIQQLARAQLLYVQDWDENLPHWWAYGSPRPEPYGPFTLWTEYFQPYLHSADVFHCPSFRWGPEGAAASAKLADYALFTWGPSGDGTPDHPSPASRVPGAGQDRHSPWRR